MSLKETKSGLPVIAGAALCLFFSSAVLASSPNSSLRVSAPEGGANDLSGVSSVTSIAMPTMANTTSNTGTNSPVGADDLPVGPVVEAAFGVPVVAENFVNIAMEYSDEESINEFAGIPLAVTGNAIRVTPQVTNETAPFLINYFGEIILQFIP